MTSNLLEYDLRDAETLANPFPVLKRLREQDPIHWSPILKGWILTRYEDVKRAHMVKTLSPDRIAPFYKSLPEKQRNILSEVIRYLNLWMVFRDPPEHTRLRKIMNSAFTPRAIQGLIPNINSIVDLLLDKLDGKKSADIVADFAMPLPALVIMDIIGIPRDMLGSVKEWSDDMMYFIGSAQGVPDKYERARSGSRQMAGYFREIIAERRKNPGTDILSTLIVSREGGESLSEDELVATCMMLLFAGHETTANMISGSLLMLHQFPEQKKKLAASPALIDTAVEEFLRFDGPSNAITRIVTRDHELQGRKLKEGDRVFAMNSAANRDPEQFSDPDMLDIGRTRNRHLTFGHGIHVCLGATLARFEGRVAINDFIRRFPNYRCNEDEPLDWINSLSMRGLKSLTVELR